MTQQYTPSVDLTIFPRINFLGTFTPRARQRSDNGRIFGRYGVRDIDNEQEYPPADGADCLKDFVPPFPLNLGSNVTVTPTALIDLRLCNGTIDLQFSNIDDYPATPGASSLSSETFPVDLGPDVTTAPLGTFDLRAGSTTIQLNPLN